MIIKHLKKHIDERLDQNTKRCAIAVPTYYDNNQRQAIVNACKIAGLEVLTVVSEPMAAAFANSIDKSKTSFARL